MRGKKSGCRQRPDHIRALQAVVRTSAFTFCTGGRHWRISKANSNTIYILTSLWLLNVMLPVCHFTKLFELVDGLPEFKAKTYFRFLVIFFTFILWISIC